MALQANQQPSTPDEILAAVRAMEPAIQTARDRIEAQRRLPPELLRTIMEAGVFRMAVPRVYGGGEFDPMTQVRVVEELSRMEGSVGWLAMIGAAGGPLAAFLDPPVAQRFYGSVDSVFAGQIRPPQHAEVVQGGFRVSGRYRFASGCQHASAMTCGCTLYENGKPLLHPNGQPKGRVMLIPASKVTIIDTWDTTGMRGTGSHDFVVDDVFVPAEESVSVLEPPRVAGPLYRFPPIYLVCHTGVPLGIARGALDCVLELCGRKELMPSRQLLRDDTHTQETIAWAEASIEAARNYAYGTLEDLWETLCRGDKVSVKQRAHYRLMMVYCHQSAKQVISVLYDLAATSAIFRSHPLERFARDIMTACQHRVVHPRMYRPGGRMLLGLDPDEPFF
jgi:alkylation response protein AidB-like acyl-CoA dehydrogenase